MGTCCSSETKKIEKSPELHNARGAARGPNADTGTSASQYSPKLPTKSALHVTNKTLTSKKNIEKKKDSGKKEEIHVNLPKNRIISHTDTALHQVIFDPDGFSVHDLGLIGQKHSKNNLFEKNTKPIQKGNVELEKDLSKIFIEGPEIVEKEGAKKQDAEKVEISEISNRDQKKFFIVEIEDYTDNLYIQLMEPEKNPSHP